MSKFILMISLRDVSENAVNNFPRLINLVATSFSLSLVFNFFQNNLINMIVDSLYTCSH